MNEREYERMYRVEDSHWWYVALHELVTRLVAGERERKGSLHILDAGCGTGRLCQLMERFGRVEGCDLSQHAVSFCLKRGVRNVFTADLTRHDLNGARYDVITSIDVLYHKGITDDAAVLGSLVRALNPGGLLILNLVAFEFLRSTHDVAVHTRKRYTRGELLSLLAQQPLSVEMATYRVGSLFLPIAGYRLFRTLLPPRQVGEVVSDVSMPSRFMNRLLLGVMRLENRLLERLRLPFGTSVFVAARRW